MRVWCLTSWEEMHVLMSRFFFKIFFFTTHIDWLLLFEFRYHIGRHVANLQVTNTYEGQFFSLFYSIFRINDLTAF